MKAEESKKTFFQFNTVLSVLLLLGITVLANILVRNRVVTRIDLTEDREHSISQATRRVLRELPGRLNIKAYISREVPAQVLWLREKIEDILKEYQVYSQGKLVVDWIDPVEGAAKKEAEDAGVRILRIQAEEGDEVVEKQIAFGMLMRFKDREKLIPLVVPKDIPTLEYQLTTAIKALTDPKKKTVGFLTREGPATPQFPGMEQQGGDRIFTTARKVLEDRYQVKDIEVKDGNPVPSEVDVLVVARPKNMSEREKFEIDQFIMRGGHVMFLVDKDEYSLQTFGRTALQTGLDDLFEHYGFRIEKELIFDRSSLSVQIPEVVEASGQSFQVNRSLPYPFWVRVTSPDGLSKENPITGQLNDAVFLWVNPITVLGEKLKDIKVEKFINSSELSWRTDQVDKTFPEQSNLTKIAKAVKAKKPEASTIAISLSGKFHSFFDGKDVPIVKKDVDPKEPPKEPEPPKEIPKIVNASPETSLLVFGDADFILDRVVARAQPNLVLFLNAIDWMVLDRDLIAIRSKTIKDRPILDFKQEYEKQIGKTSPEKLEDFDPEAAENIRSNKSEVDEKTRVAKFWIKWGNLLGMPALVVMAGLFHLMARNKARRKLMPPVPKEGANS